MGRPFQNGASVVWFHWLVNTACDAFTAPPFIGRPRLCISNFGITNEALIGGTLIIEILLRSDHYRKIAMARSVVQGLHLEPLLCKDQNDEYPPHEFAPFCHDIVVLNNHGRPEIARNASVGDMIGVLNRSNSACRDLDRIEDTDVPPLILMYALCLSSSKLL
jgi:hypothetical protein